MIREYQGASRECREMCVPPVSSVTDKAGREVLFMLGPGMRMAAQTAPIEAGAVHLPSHASWIDEFKKEILSFPPRQI